MQARVDAGKKVSFVDIHGALTVSDLVDGVHPNADGYLKMAQAWLPAVEATLPHRPRPAPTAARAACGRTTDAPPCRRSRRPRPTEVGVRFRVEKYGQITGIRFYKGPQNTGMHKGSLWARDRRLLATATFTNETAPGWQQVNFSSPVTVWPWTTYVASYFAPVGRYAADHNVFASTEIVAARCACVAAGQSGGNGWSVGSASGGFPSVGLLPAANFWVDVVFTPVDAGAAAAAAERAQRPARHLRLQLPDQPHLERRRGGDRLPHRAEPGTGHHVGGDRRLRSGRPGPTPTAGCAASTSLLLPGGRDEPERGLGSRRR